MAIKYFEVMADNFAVLIICISYNYEHKYININLECCLYRREKLISRCLLGTFD
jgi:hypothetical protein